MSIGSKVMRDKARRFAKALRYLDSCGRLDKDKFVEVSLIADETLTRAELEQMWEGMALTIARNGDAELRQTLRETFAKGLALFGATADGLEELTRNKV